MCGIAGFIDFKNEIKENMLRNMTDVLHHRGPDDSGYFLKKNDTYQVALGQRRLSILDLSKHGHQPMKYDDLIISYNGEVYNFLEIRQELEALGHTFISTSDTEVLLHSFKEWGKEAVHKFNGMFVFTLFDESKSKVYIYRDRAGVKPLYWYFKDDLFLFSSELKSFHEVPFFTKVINKNSLALYLQYGYIPQPYTIFKDTYKLKSGHFIEINLETKKITEHEYWNIQDFYNKPKLDVTEEEALTEIEALLQSSFEYRMVSDVPVGVFLSGGYDSSVVTAILQKNRAEKIKTFTIGFHEKGFDEAPYAKQVANMLGTEHVEYYCTQKDALEILPLLPEIYDEPFGDSSAIPTVLVSKLAKKDVSVSLSADGGDEIFAGYTRHSRVLSFYKKFKKIPKPIKKMMMKPLSQINFKSLPALNNKYNLQIRYERLKSVMMAEDIGEAMMYVCQNFTNQELRALLASDFILPETGFESKTKNDDLLNKMLLVDYKTFMIDDVLTKVDRATMSVSLEGREPMLDYRISEYMAQLPSSLKYKNKMKKYLLKKVTHKYLPETLMSRPKMGFQVPIIEWFKEELKEYFMKYLDKNRLNKEGFFNSEEVERLRDEYLSGSKNNINKLWFILMFEMWYEKWM